MFQTVKLCEAGESENQDRAVIIDRGNSLVLVVADGAGGRSGGGKAADMVVRAIRESATTVPSAEGPLRWCEILRMVDLRIHEDLAAGESTSVVAMVSGTRIVGASVGDSGAWRIHCSDVHDLTSGQQRKPLLGTGVAAPVPFESDLREGTLLLATDGLLKYASRSTIRDSAQAIDLSSAAKALVDSVRLRSGGLQDDVALILCRQI